MRALYPVLIALLFAAVPLLPTQAYASEEGPTLITVGGDVSNPNRGPVDDFEDAYFNAQDISFDQAATFDLARLQSLGMKEITVSYPDWPKSFTFSGPLLSDVLKAAGAQGDTIAVTAIDGYAPEIPISDLETYPVILALKKDGKFLGVGGHGPAWVIYPRDDYPALADSDDSKYVWAVFYIDVR